MPKVNLRLTDQELEQLQAWAKDGRRSLQKEIVYRLFRERAIVGRDPEDDSGYMPLPAVSAAKAAATMTDLATSSSGAGFVRDAGATQPSPGPAPEDSFKPDFKKPEKPKRTGFRKS